MGPPPDPEQMITMLENPQFQSTINEALQNPQVLDMMIQQNPMLRNMPGVRQIIQSPEFLRMMTDPESIRSITQMQRAMGTGPFGGAGGQNAFPAPGVINTTPAENRDGGVNSSTPNQTNTTGTPQPPVNPFGMFGNPGAAAAGANPFAALFVPTAFPQTAAQGTPAAAPTGTPNATQDPPTPANPLANLFNPALLAQLNPAGTNPTQQAQQPPQNQNPFANLATNPLFQNPQLMQQMLQAMNGAGGGNPSAGGGAAANPFLSLMGPGGISGLDQAAAAPPSQDSRPPEERYEEQLRQLNEMGFHEFERNVEALRRTGGIVQYAVEYLLNH